LSLAETELNMANCEVERLRRQIEEDADHNKRIIKDELGGKQKKKELLLEIDQLRREVNYHIALLFLFSTEHF
jgi:hypothetical protein